MSEPLPGPAVRALIDRTQSLADQAERDWSGPPTHRVDACEKRLRYRLLAEEEALSTELEKLADAALVELSTGVWDGRTAEERTQALFVACRRVLGWIPVQYQIGNYSPASIQAAPETDRQQQAGLLHGMREAVIALRRAGCVAAAKQPGPAAPPVAQATIPVEVAKGVLPVSGDSLPSGLTAEVYDGGQWRPLAVGSLLPPLPDTPKSLLAHIKAPRARTATARMQCGPGITGGGPVIFLGKAVFALAYEFFYLPAMEPLFSAAAVVEAEKLPPWNGEPQSDPQAVQMLDALAECLQAAVAQADGTPSATSGEAPADAPPAVALPAAPVTQEEVEAADEAPWPLLMAASDLARRLGMTDDAVGSFLRRYREKYDDCYEMVESPRRNEPKILYRTADVLPFLKQRRDKRK